MPHEKINKLEKITSENKERISSLEHSLGNIEPLVDEVKELVRGLHKHSIVLAENTIAYNHTKQSMDRAYKRIEKQEDQMGDIVNEMAEWRPQMKNYGKIWMKLIYGAFGAVLVAVALAFFVAKNIFTV